MFLFMFLSSAFANWDAYEIKIANGHVFDNNLGLHVRAARGGGPTCRVSRRHCALPPFRFRPSPGRVALNFEPE